MPERKRNFLFAALLAFVVVASGFFAALSKLSADVAATLVLWILAAFAAGLTVGLNIRRRDPD